MAEHFEELDEPIKQREFQAEQFNEEEPVVPANFIPQDA